MKLRKLDLHSFRNLKKFSLSCHEVDILVGKNGSGKTSVIEAIFLLASGQSFRAKKIEEMITFERELGRVIGQISDKKEAKPEDWDHLEIKLTRGKVQGKRTPKRLYSINGAGKQKKTFLRRLSAVVFRPEDMRLIEGSPGRRRQFVDTILSSVSPAYFQAIHTYEQALKRYNKLLFAVREGEQPKTVLQYWELMLIKHGAVVTEQRRKFFEFLHQVSFPFPFDVRYEPSLITDKRMEEYRDRGIAAGHILIGPHKDDFMVLFANSGMKNRELDAYGSRGQQRLGVLWLKLGELRFLEEKLGEKPLLLLDDIFSELDEKAKEMVLALVGEHQTILTTADTELAAELESQLKKVLGAEAVFRQDF